MARLDELRNRFRVSISEPVAAPSPAPKAPSTTTVRVDSSGRARARYKVSASGDDALLMFGKHKGLTLKSIAQLDPTYLAWLQKEEFPIELKELAKSVLGKENENRRNLLADLRASAESHKKNGRNDLSEAIWTRVREIRSGGAISKEDFDMCEELRGTHTIGVVLDELSDEEDDEAAIAEAKKALDCED